MSKYSKLPPRVLAAREALAELQAPRAADLATMHLADLVVHLHPGFERPDHMMPVIEPLELSLIQEVRLVLATPSQHGKTKAVLSRLVKGLAVHRASPLPMHSAYFTYNEVRARHMSDECRSLAQLAGLETTGNQLKWGIPLGPDIIWGGIGTGIVGNPVNSLFVVDDPIKDETQAESPAYRDRAWGWWETAADTRCHPGTSKIVVATRWNEDDLSGRLIRKGWQYINLPAIACEGDPYGRIEGTALWPSMRPLSWLKQKLEGENAIDLYTWEAMWQGNPLPRSGAVFEGEVCYYGDENQGDLPAPDVDNLTIGHGIDLAYTSSTKGDWSVIVTLGYDGKHYYMLDVVRRRCSAPDFARQIQAKVSRRPGPVVWYSSGPEKGVAQLVNDHLGDGVKIRHIATNVDKLTRTIPCSNAWASGKILLPRTAAWDLRAVRNEICSFQGRGHDLSDDVVDALVAAFRGLQRRLGSGYQAKRHRRRQSPLYRV